MYGKRTSAGRLVEDRDGDDLGVEDLLDLVADDVVDRLHLELAGERLLDAVDQRELGVPLPRLLDRARARERRADVLADEREQVLVLLGVAEPCCVRLRRRARRPSAPPASSGTPSQSSVGSPSSSTSPCSISSVSRSSGMQLRLARSEHVGGDAPRLARAELVPLVRVGELSGRSRRRSTAS